MRILYIQMHIGKHLNAPKVTYYQWQHPLGHVSILWYLFNKSPKLTGWHFHMLWKANHICFVQLSKVYTVVCTCKECLKHVYIIIWVISEINIPASKFWCRKSIEKRKIISTSKFRWWNRKCPLGSSLPMPHLIGHQRWHSV